MYNISVRVETWSETYCDILRVRAANSSAAKAEAERMLLEKHGLSDIVSMQITGIAKA